MSLKQQVMCLLSYFVLALAACTLTRVFILKPGLVYQTDNSILWPECYCRPAESNLQVSTCTNKCLVQKVFFFSHAIISLGPPYFCVCDDGVWKPSPRRPWERCLSVRSPQQSSATLEGSSTCHKHPVYYHRPRQHCGPLRAEQHCPSVFTHTTSACGLCHSPLPSLWQHKI